MAKVTVYVTDDQLERLKAAKGFSKGGVSKMFQAFIDSATAGNDTGARYDYARSLMPTLDAVDRHRRRLARKVQAGGPPADGGPVAAAVTILLYQRLLASDPALAATLEKEFARFGLDELVAKETEGVDLLAEAEFDDEIDDGGDGFDFGGLAGLAGLGRFGEDFRDALNTVRIGLRDFPLEAQVGPRRGGRRGPHRGGRRHLVVEVSPDDDPRDVLSVRDFTVFQARHNDWAPGERLTPSQMESVRELLIRRAGGDPAADDAEPESEGATDTTEGSAE